MMCKEVSSFRRDSQFCIKCADVVKSAEEANKEKQAAAKEEEEQSVTSSEDSEKDTDNPADKYADCTWVLSMTDYTDDYKPRGENWSHSKKPRLFSTAERAEAALLAELLKYMYDKINEQYEITDTPPFSNADGWMKLNGEWRLQQENAECLEDVEDEIIPFIQGEFVSVKLSWKVHPVHIDA